MRLCDTIDDDGVQTDNFSRHEIIQVVEWRTAGWAQIRNL